MCGIFGHWSQRDELARLGAALAHRGPDGEGRFDDGLIHIGNRRLAIVDLSDRGRQPIVSDDGLRVLTFNGEIYNHRELRRRLEARGHFFKTRTDSEVLLACFREWGDAAVHELAGMFAIALWKADERELLLLRDATGVKPLFYAELEGGSFAFASELQAMLELSGLRREIEEESLWQYLEFGFCWTDDRTVLRQVRKVQAGHLVRIHEGRVAAVEAWDRPPAAEHSIETREQLDREADELMDVLVAVVREQLNADVPSGLLLSGGLDSSILAAICGTVLKAEVPTFTVGFRGASQEDLRSARMVATATGGAHRELVLDGAAIARELSANASRYDDLFWDPGLLSLLAVFRWCRDLGTVVTLVGEGADELFGGYSSFGRLGSREQQGLAALPATYRFFRHYTGQASGRSLQGALRHIRRIHNGNGDRWYETVRDFELHHQLPNNLNAKLDRASMASAVEARVPYQDPRVTATVLKLRGDGALEAGGKTLLKHVARRHALLPESVISREKLGLMTPRAWIVSDPDLRDLAERTLFGEGRWARRLGIEERLAELFATDPRTAAISADLNLAWRVLILEHWSRSLGLSDAPLV